MALASMQKLAIRLLSNASNYFFLLRITANFQSRSTRDKITRNPIKNASFPYIPSQTRFATPIKTSFFYGLTLLELKIQLFFSNFPNNLLAKIEEYAIL